MVNFAYKDKARLEKDKLEANKAKISDKGVEFYCPNHSCNAKLTIRSLGDDAYFAAKKTAPHVCGCPYKSINGNYHKYDEKMFDFDILINDLCAQSLTSNHTSTQHPTSHSKTSSSSEGAIRTLRLLHSMCKDKNIDDTYNNQVIGRMLLDDRSITKYHNRGIWNNKIVECISERYNLDKKEIWLSAPITTSTYKIILIFNDKNLYEKIKNRIWKNSPTHNFQNVGMVVAGNWSKYLDKINHFKTEITSEKQIILL